jgi:hypothetical protein
MAHTTAVIMDERVLIFKIILRRLLLVLLQLERALQIWDANQPPLPRCNFLAIVGAYTCNKMLGGFRRR